MSGIIDWPLSKFGSKTSLAETEPFSLQGGKHLNNEEWWLRPQHGFWVTLWRTHKGELLLESNLALWVFAGPAQTWGDMEGHGGNAGQGSSGGGPLPEGLQCRSLRRADLAFPPVLMARSTRRRPCGETWGQVLLFSPSTAKEMKARKVGLPVLQHPPVKQQILRTHGSRWLSALAQGGSPNYTSLSLHALGPGGFDGFLSPSLPETLLLCIAFRIHPLPARPCLGPQGPPTAPRGVYWIVRFVLLGDRGGAALRLSSRALSWHRGPGPTVLSPCSPLWLRGRAPWMHIGWPPLPSSPAFLSAICSFCPAGQQTCSLG